MKPLANICKDNWKYIPGGPRNNRDWPGMNSN